MRFYLAIPPGPVRDTFLPPENLRLLESLGEAVFPAGDTMPTASEVARDIGNADAYVTVWGSPRLDEEILAAAPNLRLLVHLCGTVVPFVSDAMWQRGIRVISGNDFFADSVAEGVIGYLLTVLRDIPRYAREFKSTRQWPKEKHPRGLLDKTVGLVSYGAVARHTARLLYAFRCRLLVYDIVPVPEEDKAAYGITQVDLETLFRESEIVSVHAPYNPHTHHLITRDLLRLLRPGTVFLNTSRGPVIDEAALVEALRTQDFRALLDVYEVEPPAADNPLFDLPNVYMMPHMGGPTEDRRKYIADALLREAKRFVCDGGGLGHEISRDKAAQMSKS